MLFGIYLLTLFIKSQEKNQNIRTIIIMSNIM